MREIEPRIKPLFRDLSELSIGAYLASTEFDRHALKNGIENIWNQAIEAFDRENNVVILGFDMTKSDREQALRILLNWAIRSSQSDFNSLIFIILNGFLEWNNQQLSFEKIFEDLELAGLPLIKVGELREKYLARQKIIQSIKTVHAKEKSEKTNESLPSPNAFIESKKTAWIDKIAEADIEGTLEDIKNYAREDNNLKLTKEVINLSSRYHRIKQDNNKGTIKNDEKEREINKINESLVELIMNLK